MKSLQLLSRVSISNINITIKAMTDPSARQRLPNELIDSIFKCVDPSDKRQCSSICRTSKAGMRAMYGMNEQGESIGTSPMYHTVGHTKEKVTVAARGRRLVLLIRTLLDRPLLVNQVSALEYVVGKIDEGTRFADLIWPRLPKLPQRLHLMGLPHDFVRALPVKGWSQGTQESGFDLFLVLAIMCPNLRSISLDGSIEDCSPMDKLSAYYNILAEQRVLSPAHGKTGKCGLDSIQHITIRGINPHRRYLYCDRSALGLALPSLHRLTIHDLPTWGDRAMMLGGLPSLQSALQHIEMINCDLDALCPETYGGSEGMLVLLPNDTSEMELEIISPNQLLSTEDLALVEYAVHKQFKSLTIYNCTKDSWVSSCEQADLDQAAVEAFSLVL